MQNDSWKTKVLIVGGLLGLVAGLGAGYIVVQRAEQQHMRPSLSAGDGVKVGLGVLGLLRLIADIGDD